MKLYKTANISHKKYWTLKEYYERRNHILIFRCVGGLGDILMHRMIFEDFKKLNPEAKITFACPIQFFQAIQGHPFVDEVVDSRSVDRSNFIVHYDTSSICARQEMAAAPFSTEHRSDIWANWCSVSLTCHNMHLKISPEDILAARKIVGNGVKVCVSPISAISSKNLDESQIEGICSGLKSRGFDYYGVHTNDIQGFDGPVYSGKDVKQFMSLVGVADYLISVDTSTFHIGGGLGIPMVGIFSWADGKVYGKYYDKWELVQRHRDSGWECGPCYTWGNCQKCPSNQQRKPCITEITSNEILEAFDRIIAKYAHGQSYSISNQHTNCSR